MTGSVYEPTQDFCSHILGRMNVTTTYFDPLIGAGIAELIQPNTRVVFLESPGSITMEVQDIPAMVQAIRAVAPEVVIMIDNTWAAGVLFKRWTLISTFPSRPAPNTLSAIPITCSAPRSPIGAAGSNCANIPI